MRRRTGKSALADYGLAGQGMTLYYVYILVSDLDPARHYTGRTKDLLHRIDKHNAGEVPHTAKYRPWRLETYVAFTHESKAITFERYLKSGSGREFARRHF